MRKVFLFLILILLLPAVFSSTFNLPIELQPNWQQFKPNVDCYENNDKIQLINKDVVVITIECKTYNEDRDIMPFEISVVGGFPKETLNFSEQKHEEKTIFNSKINLDLFFDECNVGNCVSVKELKIELPASIVPKLKAFVANESAKSLQEKMEGQRPVPTETVEKIFYISELDPNEQDFAEEIACFERECSIVFAGKEHGEKIIVLDLAEVFDAGGGIFGWLSWAGVSGSANFDVKVLGKLDETINFKEDTVDNWRTHSSSGVQMMLYLDHFAGWSDGTYVQEVKIRLGDEYVNILKKYYETSVTPPAGAETGNVKVKFTDWISPLKGTVSNPIAKINENLTVKESGTNREITHEVSGENFIILKDVKVGGKYILNVASFKAGDKTVKAATGTSDLIKAENLIGGGS